jgi:endonuclease/exonuclease/phosphatase family metal-dependent hydrolase
MTTLRVLSYNIHHGADARDRPALPAIAETIRATEADVICLQEVDRRWGDRSGRADQVAELADRLGMHGHFEAALRRGEGGYGNAVLTRVAPLWTQRLDLPTPEGIERRVAILAGIDTATGPLTVACTHLTVEPQLRRVRVAQLRTVLDELAATEGPVILAADFNSSAARGELRDLETTMRHARHHPFSLRAWGVMLGRPATATFPASWPYRRIDRIYVSPRLRVHRVKVVASRASDHRPLQVDLHMAGGAETA